MLVRGNGTCKGPEVGTSLADFTTGGGKPCGWNIMKS